MIPWYVYTFISVIFATLFAIFRKKALLKTHAMNFEASRSLAVAFLCLFLIPFIDLNISWKIVGLIYIVSLLATIGILLSAKSFRHKDISLIYPLGNIKPVFVVVLAYFFLSEIPHLKQFFGIGIILVSAYLLEADHHISNLWEPIKNFVVSKYSIYFVIAIFLFSITAIFDRYIITTHMNIFSYYFLIWMFIALNFNIVHLIEFGTKDTIKCYKKLHFTPLLVAFFSFSANLLALKALSMAYVSLVTSALLLTTLLVVFFGGKFFHERYFMFRSVVSLLMLIGVYLIII